MNHKIEEQIYLIRGQRIMLDEHLAQLYHVEPKVLNQAVRRNIRRFPPEFMFQLNLIEYRNIRSQNVTASKRNVRYLPLAFTEHGIAMLSSVLKSERAIQINIAIIKTFIKLRHAMTIHKDLTLKVERLEGKMDLVQTDVRLLYDEMHHLKNRPEKTGPRVKGFEQP